MNTVKAAGKTLGSLLVFGFYFFGINSAVAATLDISQKPLMLSESVAPNLIFSLDDSGSMKRSHVPDAIAADASMRTKRVKSAYFNPIYYNPDITYIIPKGINASGADLAYTTGFTSAPHMGFKSTFGSVDLSRNYRVTWYCTRDQVANCSYTVNGFGSVKELAENPDEDFRVTANVPSTAPNASVTTVGGITYNISRTSSGTNCTATANWNGIAFSNVPCSRSSNTATVDLRTQAVPAYYYVFDSTLSGCSASNARNNDGCYRLRLVSASERQNFAIWYSFYRDRALATQSAAHLAFYDMSSAVRLTWQSLNNCTNFTSSSLTGSCSDNRFRVFTDRHKSNFMSWLTNVTFSGGTPLRETLDRAGKFLQTNTAWALTPNPYTTTGSTGSTVQNPMHACRPSFHIMMTDGMWNGNNGSPTTTLRPDHTGFTLADGTQYANNRRPYADATTSTLADLAMHYWATDLSTLPNEVKPYVRIKNGNTAIEYWDPRNNPATWQHMTNYMVGLGLSEALNNVNIPWAGDTFSGGYLNILNGPTNWPAAAADNANNVYDLWHAAINSRGEFFSVDSPDDMVKAFKDILNRIAERTTTAARPAVSAAFVADNINQLQSRVYATQFSSEDWSGEVTKTTINKLGIVIPGEGWSTRTVNADLAPNLRKVMIKDAGNNTTGLQNFTWNNLTQAQQAALNINPESLGTQSDSLGQDRLNYVRGERSKEGIEYPAFRQRSTIIGDIINSSPALVGTPAYMPHLADSIEKVDRGDEYKSYGEFRVANHRSKRKEMLYVGGNDGMLHGFESETGREIFAFIPSAVIPNLNKLTGQNYIGGEHHYFVDGSPIVRDVYFDDTIGWRTVLIGTLRAGGKALFALDITDPDNIKLLWEFDSSNDEDLGYSFAQPEIVRLHSGQWAVLQGNGYNSTNDKAALLVIDIQSGELLKKIVVPDVIDDNNITLSNGLSSVRAADNNGDGLADYAYAGDLQGNIWRFDLTPSTTQEYDANEDPFSRGQDEIKGKVTPADFKLAYNGTPLFIAKDSQGKRQAITIQPSLVRHPTNRGYLVLVGTGKYFENSDANVDTSRAMTLYGIWDRKTRRQDTKNDASIRQALTRTNLQKQEFVHQEESVLFGEEGKEVSNDIRLLSQNDVKWYKTVEELGEPVNPAKDDHVVKWGWRLDLAVESVDEEQWDESADTRNGTQTLAGEMIVNNMAARGSTLLVSSLTPNDDPCQAGAVTWFYGINAYTGGRTLRNVLDLNNDRNFNPLDQLKGRVVTGRRFSAPGGFTMSPGGVFGEGGQPPMTLPEVIGTPRQSWHIIPEDFQ